MIDLHVPESAMRYIESFLEAVQQGAKLHRLEREGETIIFLRKQLRPDEGVLHKLLMGKPGRYDSAPVLRLVHGGQDRRGARKQQLEARVPGVFSSPAAKVLTRRGCATAGDTTDPSPESAIA